MDYRTEKSSTLKKTSDSLESEPLNEKLGFISLKDVPLEDRRKEAKKPLYLIRYE